MSPAVMQDGCGALAEMLLKRARGMGFSWGNTEGAAEDG